jgi:hypothetical protein
MPPRTTATSKRAQASIRMGLTIEPVPKGSVHIEDPADPEDQPDPEGSPPLESIPEETPPPPDSELMWAHSLPTPSEPRKCLRCGQRSASLTPLMALTPVNSHRSWLLSTEILEFGEGVRSVLGVLSMEIPEFGEGVWSVLGVRSQGLWLQLMCCALANCLSSISEVRSISPEVKGIEGQVVCPTFKWTRSSIELRKDVGDRDNT